MSKFLRVVGMIAGAVLLVAPGVGAFAAVGTKLAATAATIAKVATVIGGVANIGAAILHKPPPARGSVNQILIAADAPQPYVMGEGYFAGVMRHDVGYGATLKKVPNPYRFQVVVYSGGGPVQSMTPWIEFAAPGSWYSGFAYTTTRLGACPDTALVPQWAGAPGWSASSKLSGLASAGWSWLFDKDGKRFASGIPQFGIYGQWVKVYDPRLDSTFPGGSGACRALDESTYVWSESPALHAGTYALGRYQNGGKRVMGIGLPYGAIDWAAIAAWANTCDLNGWRMFGAVYEPGNRFENLRDICLAGGCEPIPGADKLGFHFTAPRVALDTITIEDLADGEQAVTPQATWRARINSIVPRYRSPAHNWELVQADPVTVDTLVTEDGELKQVEWPFNFVKDVDQAAELARYKIADARELQPIELEVGPRFRHYRPGDCLNIELFDLMRLETSAVILKKRFDPATMTVSLTLIGETAAKHGYALGLTGTAPPTPALGQTHEERDALAAAANDPSAYDALLISTSYPTDADPADGLIQATDASIMIEAHTRSYSDKTLAITGATLTVEDDGVTAIAAETLYHVYYDDPARDDTTPAFKATRYSTTAVNSPTQSARHYVGSVTTDVTGGGGTTGGGGLPPGWGGNQWENIP